MNKLLLLMLVLGTFQLKAQVGIANTDPKAQLDISASNATTPSNTDGILVPRINTFPAVNPTASQNGMLVFLTTVVGANQPGFYYWDNPTSTWIGVGSTTANQWNLGGNVGTSAATNFIGTTDNQDLILKRNNLRVGKFASTSVFLGDGAGLVNTGSQNVYIGRNAGNIGATGSSNVIIGNAAGLSNTASNNTFLGAFAGNDNGSGTGNTFLGSSAGGDNTSGGQNTFIGESAGSGNFLGSGNTMLGNNANMSANLTNATAIGAKAIVTSNNSLVLGSIIGVNSATASTNVGIGVNSPLDRLHVVGNIRMADGNQAAGKVMTSDANGTATWQNASANAWGLAGNTGTSSATNYIGTADNQDVIFKRFNIKSGLLSTNCTAFGVDALTATTLGDNTAVGYNALHISTGNFNTALGSRALQANTTGNQNTALGTGALLGNITGSSNIAIGYSSLLFNRTAGKNIAIGNFALNAQFFNNGNVAWDTNNIAIGHNALLNNQPTSTTNGMDNLAIGINALAANTIGLGNVAIGNSAMASSTVLSENTAVGFEAMKIMSFNNGGVIYQTNNTAVGYQSMMNTQPTSNVNGEANVAVGAYTLRGNTTGTYNVAVGSSALQSSTTAGNNTAVGYSALMDTSTGEDNTSIGAFSLLNNTTGRRNIAIGSNAMPFNLTANENIAVGFSTLFSNSYGGRNIAIGHEAMQNQGFANGNVAFSQNNIAIGYHALQNNNPTASTNGLDNTAVGGEAMIVNTIGAANTALGRLALDSNTIGINNTAIGYNALGTNVQGNYNTAIGSNTATTSTILVNATAIGSFAMVGNSNSMVLGSISGVNGAPNSTNVGIGTTAPVSALDVIDENITTSSTAEGNLAIASNNPQGINIGAAITLGGYNNDAATLRRVFGTIEGRKANATSGSSDGYLMFKTNNGGFMSEQMRITENGDVGIGITNPGGQFQLSLDQGRKPGTNTWTIVSDARLKNVSGSYDKGLEDIIQLRPVRYHYKNVGEKTFDSKVLDQEFAGFLAQEVQQVFPEAIGIDRDGYLNFNMHSILVASINAIKELDEKNKQLETSLQQEKEKYEALKNELDSQNQRLRAIEEKLKN